MSTEEIPREVGKLWGALKSVEGAIDTLRAWAGGQFARIDMILVGVNNDNGIKGDIRALEADSRQLAARIETISSEVRDAREWGQRIWEVERPANCLGIAAVDAFRVELDAREARALALRETEAVERRREMTELRKARIAMMGTVGAAMLTSAAAVVVALIR
jgi:hypothetical protein